MERRRATRYPNNIPRLTDCEANVNYEAKRSGAEQPCGQRLTHSHSLSLAPASDRVAPATGAARRDAARRGATRRPATSEPSRRAPAATDTQRSSLESAHFEWFLKKNSRLAFRTENSGKEIHCIFCYILLRIGLARF